MKYIFLPEDGEHLPIRLISTKAYRHKWETENSVFSTIEHERYGNASSIEELPGVEIYEIVPEEESN